MFERVGPLLDLFGELEQSCPVLVSAHLGSHPPDLPRSLA